MSTRHSGSTTAVLIALLATAAAGGIGKYAWELRKQHIAATQELTECSERTGNIDQAQQELKACQSAKTLAATERAQAEKFVDEMRTDLSATKEEIQLLRKQRAETAKRLASFQELTEKFQKMIDSGRLDVVIRDGRMVVKLPAGVLFPSGSAELSRDGELALMEVAVVLRHFKDRKFIVEGHTDNRPLEAASATTRYRNNWELSVGRAIKVIEFLTEARLKPENLLAAGHGEFDPVGDNNTVKGRAENRRIEIVMLPLVQDLPATTLASARGETKQAPRARAKK